MILIFVIFVIAVVIVKLSRREVFNEREVFSEQVALAMLNGHLSGWWRIIKNWVWCLWFGTEERTRKWLERPIRRQQKKIIKELIIKEFARSASPRPIWAGSARRKK
jgi:hypothetical protein